jgi:hypothetical protein
MKILVFKYNISGQSDVRHLKPIFDNRKEILAWNVDTEDVDKVLRIETNADISENITEMVENAGYWCNELE